MIKLVISIHVPDQMTASPDKLDNILGQIRAGILADRTSGGAVLDDISATWELINQ